MGFVRDKLKNPDKLVSNSSIGEKDSVKVPDKLSDPENLASNPSVVEDSVKALDKLSDPDKVVSVSSIGEKDSIKVLDKKLPDQTTVAHLFCINKYLGLLSPGITGDARNLARQAKKEAAEFLLRNEYEMPADVLARWIADTYQLHTLHACMGPLGIVAIVLGTDDGKRTQLVKSYPAVHLPDQKATSAGLIETNNSLEKMENDMAFSYEETVQVAVSALQSVAPEYFRATTAIEVCIRGADNLTRKVLSTEEIDQLLTKASARIKVC